MVENYVLIKTENWGKVATKQPHIWKQIFLLLSPNIIYSTTF